MRARLFSLLTLIGLVVACDSGGPTPPPAPVPQPALVQLKANDILVFAGQRISLQTLVLRVTDLQGRPLTDYTLAAQLPAGWTVRGDTVVAPATEAVARLKVTATYLPGATLALGASPHFDSHATDSTDTATVTSGVDLKARQWRVSYTCADSGIAGGVMYDVTRIDSLRVDELPVDSVIYASDSSWVPQFGGVAQLYYSGLATFWLEDGRTVVDSIRGRQEIQRQAPDSLVTEVREGKAEGALLKVTPGTLQQLLRYEGADFCGRSWRLQRSPAIMQEVAG